MWFLWLPITWSDAVHSITSVGYRLIPLHAYWESLSVGYTNWGPVKDKVKNVRTEGKKNAEMLRHIATQYR